MCTKGLQLVNSETSTHKVLDLVAALHLGQKPSFGGGGLNTTPNAPETYPTNPRFATNSIVANSISLQF